MERMALQAHRIRTETAGPMARNGWDPENIDKVTIVTSYSLSLPFPEVYSFLVYTTGLRALPTDRPV